MIEVSQKKNKRIASFDGMRGLAALFVMFFHVLTWTEVGFLANYELTFKNPFWKIMTITPLKILWGGNEAVILFYIIGGFVIAKPYIEGRTLNFFAFFKKRFMRLVLPYWTILILTLLCIFLLGTLKNGVVLSSSFDVKWTSLPQFRETVNLFLMGDRNLDVIAGAFWSIIQEWRISLLMPFVGVLLYRYPTWKVFTGTMVLNRVLALLLQAAPSLHRTNYYFIYFFLGAVLYKHLDEFCFWFKNHRWLALLVPILIPFQWIMAGFGVTIARREALLLTGTGFVLLILAVIESKKLTQLFESSPFLFLGQISFSLYLTHSTSIVLFTTVFGQWLNPTVMLLVSPVFAIGIAKGWYEWIEKGLLQRLNKNVRQRYK
ncbi:acyltransferase [Jeotgalibaca sp. MA1X17-3]|uniref:acyltransferase family protein n=1 Tax=Jeotgalibaca sp. MA1X17-3 TaxID=2908211 RepID=UPI001F1AD98F|nr:acyltransferase [Jeotgalibaca sp. MA1X17-3]UJF15995.1 acyltransferase [Jeotgalibaca sp. MA1X17-3]